VISYKHKRQPTESNGDCIGYFIFSFSLFFTVENFHLLIFFIIVFVYETETGVCCIHSFSDASNANMINIEFSVSHYLNVLLRQKDINNVSQIFIKHLQTHPGDQLYIFDMCNKIISTHDPLTGFSKLSTLFCDFLQWMLLTQVSSHNLRVGLWSYNINT